MRLHFYSDYQFCFIWFLSHTLQCWEPPPAKGETRVIDGGAAYITRTFNFLWFYCFWFAYFVQQLRFWASYKSFDQTLTFLKSLHHRAFWKDSTRCKSRHSRLLRNWSAQLSKLKTLAPQFKLQIGRHQVKLEKNS